MFRRIRVDPRAQSSHDIPAPRTPKASVKTPCGNASYESSYKAMMLASQGDNARALAAIEQGGFQKKSVEIAQCIGKMKKDPAFK